MLEDGAVLVIDAATHAALAQAGQLRMAEDRASFWGKDRSEYLASMHEVPSMRVTYEPSGGLLLEIVNPTGQALYRRAALSAPSRSGHQPRKPEARRIYAESRCRWEACSQC